MDLLKAIRERRSIRKYRSDPVPDELILQCIEAARLAPSWANTQVSRFVVVKDRAVREALERDDGREEPRSPGIPRLLLASFVSLPSAALRA